MNDADEVGFQVQLSCLATKSTLSDAKNSIIRWTIGSMIATTALAFAIAKFVH
jgi:hypothetical protein